MIIQIVNARLTVLDGDIVKYPETVCVILDGVDYSDRCFFVDTDKRIADIYKLDDTGKPYEDPNNTGEAAWEILCFDTWKLTLVGGI